MYPLESAPSSSKLFREWLGMAADVRLLSQTDLDDFLNRGCGSLTLGDKRDLRAAVQELQERGKRRCSLFFFLKVYFFVCLYFLEIRKWQVKRLKGIVFVHDLSRKDIAYDYLSFDS